jgi:hypothetical protein
MMGGGAKGAAWPLPKLYFSVEIGDIKANFSEVTGTGKVRDWRGTRGCGRSTAQRKAEMFFT